MTHFSLNIILLLINMGNFVFQVEWLIPHLLRSRRRWYVLGMRRHWSQEALIPTSFGISALLTYTLLTWH